MLLIIPIAMHFAIPWLPRTWAYWVNLAASILAGLIILWVLFRVFGYLRYLWLEQRKRSFSQRQDPRFLTAIKIEERIKEIHIRLGGSRSGRYRLPWYGVISASSQETMAILKGSGLAFPHGADHGLQKSKDQPDQWHLANKAIFVDFSLGGLGGRTHPEVDVIYSCLARMRSQNPLSGLLLLLPVDELAQLDPVHRKQKMTGILEQLQRIQSALMLNIPVYLLVTGLQRVPGFNEYASLIPGDKSKQIVGWSESRPISAEFDRDAFRNGMSQFSRELHSQLMKLLPKSGSEILSGRLYLFQSEMEGLIASLQEAVEAVFSPNRYRDPLPLRGVYLVGAGAEGPMVSFRPRGGLGLSGPDSGLADRESGAYFLSDLFKHKILPEPGLVSRPRAVMRKNYLIWTTVVLLAACFAGGGYWWAQTNQTRRQEALSGSGPLFTQVRSLIGSGIHEGEALDLGAGLLAYRQSMDEQNFWFDLTGLARWDLLSGHLGATHRAVFQEFVLEPLLFRVQVLLKNWNGRTDHVAFVRALAEYMRWSNPANHSYADLHVSPLLDFLGVPEYQSERCRQQFEAFQKEGGVQGSLDLKGDRGTVRMALNKLSAFLSPQARLDDQGYDTWSETQWWMKLSRDLERLQRNYQVLLKQPMPKAGDSMEKTMASYETLVNNLSDLLIQLGEMKNSIAGASSHKLQWINVESLFKDLTSAARGWPSIEKQVYEAQSAAEDFNRRVVLPLRNNLHMVQFFYGMPGAGWLGQSLLSAFGDYGKAIENPSYQVGQYVRELIEALGQYHLKMSQWAQVQDEAAGDPKGLSSFDTQAPLMRQEYLNLLVEENGVVKAHQELRILAGEPQDSGAAQAAAGAAQASGQPASMQSAASRMLGIPEQGQQEQKTMQQAMLRHFRWDLLDAKIDRWIKVFATVRQYKAAQTWNSLALNLKLGADSLQEAGWEDIKKEPLFDLEQPEILIQPISQFIRDWKRSLPRELASLGQGDNPQAASPELADFEETNKLLLRFEQNHLPNLRKAAQAFVGCVHNLSLSPHRAWSQIWSTSGPGASGQNPVSWGALHSLENFIQAFKSQEGDSLQQIITPLAALEKKVRNVFERSVVDDFLNTWNALLTKYEKLGFNVSFPFMPQGERETELNDLIHFFQDLETLGKTYHIVQQPPNKDAAPAALPGDALNTAVFPEAKRIIKLMQSGQRQSFIEQCVKFRQFIEGRSLDQPLSAQVAMVPGEIGRLVHWVRLAFANGNHYDLNVYGKPPVEVPVHGREGTVTFQGLDVNKIPVTAFKFTQGDLAFLQLPYSFGAHLDQDRKHWLVEGRLPSVDEPGKMVPFKVNLLFNQGLPQPLFWPVKAR